MLAIAYAVSGSAYDFYAFDATGLVYNGSAWVAWDDVDFESYRIPAAESGTSGRFIASLPDDTARYAMRASGADLAGSYLVWEDAVASGGLLPDERAKIMLIGTDGALVEIVDPVAKDGSITLYTGLDYVAGAAGPLRIPVPSAVQDRCPAVGQPVFFQGRRSRSGNAQYFEASGIVVDDAGAKAVEITIPRGSLDSVDELGDLWVYFVGDRPSTLQDFFVTGNLTICAGAFPPA